VKRRSGAGAQVEELRSLPLDIKKLMSHRGGSSGGRGGRNDYGRNRRFGGEAKLLR